MVLLVHRRRYQEFPLPRRPRNVTLKWQMSSTRFHECFVIHHVISSEDTILLVMSVRLSGLGKKEIFSVPI